MGSAGTCPVVVSVRPGPPRTMPAGGRDEVAQHGRRRRGSAGALAVEHQLAGVLRLDEDGVEGAADGGQRVLARQQRGVDAHGDPAAVCRCAVAGQFFGDGQQLDDEAGVLRGGDVRGADGGDALAVDVFQGEAGVEGQRRQDRGLGGGVVALDVGRRVGLRVAEALGLGEGVGELGAGGVHLVQDEVGGAVDDAQHPGDPVAGQAVADGAQDGDGPGHGGLVGQLDAGLVRLFVERRAVLRRAAPCCR